MINFCLNSYQTHTHTLKPFTGFEEVPLDIRGNHLVIPLHKRQYGKR